MTRTHSPWLLLDRRRPRARLRLYCFPYAGGGASVFRGWSDSLPDDVEVGCVELPGRGTRVSEDPIAQLPPLAGAIADALDLQPTQAFAFFGHSMGALLGFEVVRRLRARHQRLPSCLFVSGCLAPQVFRLEPPIHQLPDHEFLEELKRLNGSPTEVLEHQELMQLLLPSLRADFAVCETYEYLPAKPLDCPIHAFVGLEDEEVTQEDALAWESQTSARFSYDEMQGDHFFVHSTAPRLLRRLEVHLRELLHDGPAYAS